MAPSSTTPSQVIIASSVEDIPQSPVDGKPTIVYWNIVGLAGSIRLALALSGVDFVDVRIADGSAWFQAKAKLPVHFPNLPYYMDSKVSLSQSDAILTYLGRAHRELMGGDEGQEHRVDQALDVMKDDLLEISKCSYYTGREELVAWYEARVSKIVTQWTKFLDNKPFVTGDKLSVADLKLYTFLLILKLIQKNCGNDATGAAFDGWADEYMGRIEEIPQIKEYMASEQYMPAPWSNVAVAKIDF